MLLVGGLVTSFLFSSLVFSVKDVENFDPAIPLLGFFFPTGVSAQSVVIVKNWKPPMYPSTGIRLTRYGLFTQESSSKKQ